MCVCVGGGGGGGGMCVMSSTSLFYSKKNVGTTHKLQTNKQTQSTCIEDSYLKSVQYRKVKLKPQVLFK